MSSASTYIQNIDRFVAPDAFSGVTVEHYQNIAALHNDSSTHVDLQDAALAALHGPGTGFGPAVIKQPTFSTADDEAYRRLRRDIDSCVNAADKTSREEGFQASENSSQSRLSSLPPRYWVI